MIGKCGCAIICRYVPLVLLHFDYIPLVDEVSHLGAIPLVIKTWDKHYYVLSRDCIAEVFDHWADDVDPHCFTMNGLYFATV